jgi:hypothetical protein
VNRWDRFGPAPTGCSSPRITAVRIPELERNRRYVAASAVVRSNGNGRAGGAGVVRSPVAARETPMELIYAPCWSEARDFEPGT